MSTYNHKIYNPYLLKNENNKWASLNKSCSFYSVSVQYGINGTRYMVLITTCSILLLVISNVIKFECNISFSFSHVLKLSKISKFHIKINRTSIFFTASNVCFCIKI